MKFLLLRSIPVVEAGTQPAILGPSGASGPTSPVPPSGGRSWAGVELRQQGEDRLELSSSSELGGKTQHSIATFYISALIKSK